VIGRHDDAPDLPEVEAVDDDAGEGDAEKPPPRWRRLARRLAGFDRRVAPGAASAARGCTATRPSAATRTGAIGTTTAEQAAKAAQDRANALAAAANKAVA